MRALVTGASSGIGKDMAKYLNELGYDLILVARDEEKLKKVAEEFKKTGKEAEYKTVDLTDEKACIKLYEEVSKQYGTLDLVINNAGFGLFGEFTKTDLTFETNMIKTNVLAVHILTKLFLQDMQKKNCGTILNVASVAGFMPGPLMATYYATKNYVYRFTESIQHELRKEKSKVHVCVLCPGPVATNFNKVAKVQFNLNQRSSTFVAKYAIEQALKGKKVILPGFEIKLARFFSKLVPDRILAAVCYHMQERKR